MLSFTVFPKGTIARCNACQKKFPLSKDCKGYEFGKELTTRLNNFDSCLHCGRFDCHWIFKEDIKETE